MSVASLAGPAPQPTTEVSPTTTRSETISKPVFIKSSLRTNIDADAQPSGLLFCEGSAITKRLFLRLNNDCPRLGSKDHRGSLIRWSRGWIPFDLCPYVREVSQS